MIVTIHPQAIHANGQQPHPRCGVISITREPGGTLGCWQRTALLFRDDLAYELDQQIHKAEIVRWSSAGIEVAGLERHWRRKTCTEFAQIWLITFPGIERTSVYPLRERGERRPRQTVGDVPPMIGLLQIYTERMEARPTRSTKVAWLTAPDGAMISRLDDVVLQRWGPEGLILAGKELNVATRCNAARQSWYVTFPEKLAQ